MISRRERLTAMMLGESVRVTRGLDEEQATVDTGVLDVALTLGRKLLSEVGRMLVFDVLDDGIPAPVVVNLISVSWGVNDVKAEPDAVLLDDYAFT